MSTGTNRPFLLKNQPALYFQRAIAKEFGLGEAVILQQLHYLLTQTNSGREIGGRKWIFMTYEEWVARHFSFWSLMTVRRYFVELEAAGVIESCQPEGIVSRRKAYRIVDEARFDMEYPTHE